MTATFALVSQVTFIYIALYTIQIVSKPFYLDNRKIMINA